MGNTVALGQLAAQFQQHPAVLNALHTLGDDLPAKSLGNGQDAPENSHVFRVLEKVADKTLVDLDQLGRQLLQVGER